MVERGKDHLGALCVVAANLAERAWAVMDRGMPYVVCDTDGRPVTAEEAKAIIAEHWTVPADVRVRRRSKKVGKAPRTSSRDDRSLAREAQANGATFPGGHPQPPAPVSSTKRTPVLLERLLDNRSSIGNQVAKTWRRLWKVQAQRPSSLRGLSMDVAAGSQVVRP